MPRWCREWTPDVEYAFWFYPFDEFLVWWKAYLSFLRRERG